MFWCVCVSQIRCEMEVVSREERRQHEERRVVLRGVSVQQQATEQQMGGYQQRITSVGKILNQLKTGMDGKEWFVLFQPSTIYILRL